MRESREASFRRVPITNRNLPKKEQLVLDMEKIPLLAGEIKELYQKIKASKESFSNLSIFREFLKFGPGGSQMESDTSLEISRKTEEIRSILAIKMGIVKFLEFEDEITQIAREAGEHDASYRYAYLADHPELLDCILKSN